MVREAEQYAQQDAAARSAAEERNAADTLAYGTEKALSEAGERISETDRQSVQSALTDLREALKGSDADAIRSARERLEQVWQPVASSLYTQAGAGAQYGPGAQGSATEAGPQGGNEDVVDAEFHAEEG
jgi:molecular chaperone DnaK